MKVRVVKIPVVEEMKKNPSWNLRGFMEDTYEEPCALGLGEY